MTWIESWEGTYNGSWYGPTIPEPAGSMRAILSGSSSLTAALVSGLDKKGGSSSKHRKAIMRDDEDLLLCISQYMCISSNN